MGPRDTEGRGARSARSLKTAALVLHALRLLGEHPEGLSSADLAGHLGKSSATARYLINTLCEAGYARRDAASGTCRLGPHPPWGTWGAAADVDPVEAEPRALLSEAVTELYRCTRQRAYLIRRAGTAATVIDARGHQGLARVPGLTEHVPTDHAHALALTKVLLAVSPAYLDAVERQPLEALTPTTITTIAGLRRELATTRDRGYAVEGEEFAEGSCGVAAPIPSPSGRSTLGIGLSTSVRRFALESRELAEAVTRVAEVARRQWADHERRSGPRSAEEGPPALGLPVSGRRR